MASKNQTYKLVLLGEAAVGKSSSVERFVNNQFAEYQAPTIGAAFLTQSVEVEDGIVKFEIWDTAGQERYRSLAPMYYRGAAAALVIYDITNMQSFERAKTWVEELQRQATADIVIALAGNKSDMEKDRKVPFELAKQYADENRCILYETSAKTGHNIRAIFTAVAAKLPKSTPGPQVNDSIHLLSQAEVEKKSSCC